MATRDVSHLARRRSGRRSSGLHDRGRATAWSCSTRCTASRRAGERSGRALELQGREMRVVLGGDQREAAADVHDAAEPAAARPAGDGRADADVSRIQGPGDRCVLELSR